MIAECGLWNESLRSEPLSFQLWALGLLYAMPYALCPMRLQEGYSESLIRTPVLLAR